MAAVELAALDQFLAHLHEFLEFLRHAQRTGRLAPAFLRLAHRDVELFRIGDHPGDADLVVAHRPLQRAIAPVVLEPALGALLDQQARQFLAPLVDRHHQHAGAVGAQGVDIGALLHQVIDHLALPGEDRIVQRRPLARRRIDPRAAVDQPLDRLELPAPGGEDDRRLAVAVHPVDVGAARNEQPHHVDVAFPGADHQAGADAAAHEIGGQSGVQPGFGLIQIAQFEVGHESNRGWQCRRVARPELGMNRPYQAHPDYHCDQQFHRTRLHRRPHHIWPARIFS